MAKGLRVCRPQAAHCQKEGCKPSGWYWSTWRNIKHLCTNANTTELIWINCSAWGQVYEFEWLAKRWPLAPTRHLCSSPSHAGGYYIGPLDKAGQAQWGDVGRCGSPRKPRVTCVQDHRQLIPLFLSNCQVRVSEMPSTQLVLHLPPQTLPSTPSSRAQWALRDLDGALPDLNASARCHVEWQKEWRIECQKRRQLECQVECQNNMPGRGLLEVKHFLKKILWSFWATWSFQDLSAQVMQSTQLQRVVQKRDEQHVQSSPCLSQSQARSRSVRECTPALDWRIWASLRHPGGLGEIDSFAS